MDLINWIERHEQMNIVQMRRVKTSSLILNKKLAENLFNEKKFSKLPIINNNRTFKTENKTQNKADVKKFKK